MKVKEVIRQLECHDENLEVYVYGERNDKGFKRRKKTMSVSKSSRGSKEYIQIT